MSEGGLGGFAMQGWPRADGQVAAMGNAGVPRTAPRLGAANALA